MFGGRSRMAAPLGGCAWVPSSSSRRRKDQAVAEARLGDQQVRGCRVVQLLPEVGDVDAQVLRLLLVAGAPDVLEQEGVAAEAAGVGGQHLQEAVFDPGEPHRLAVAGDL